MGFTRTETYWKWHLCQNSSLHRSYLNCFSTINGLSVVSCLLSLDSITINRGKELSEVGVVVLVLVVDFRFLGWFVGSILSVFCFITKVPQPPRTPTWGSANGEDILPRTTEIPKWYTRIKMQNSSQFTQLTHEPPPSWIRMRIVNIKSYNIETVINVNV